MIKAFDIFFILLSLAAFFYGLNRRFRLWKIGKVVKRPENIGIRIKSFLVEGILHRRILQDRYPGLIHLFIFLGFIVPFAVIVIVQFMFAVPASIARLLSLFLDVVALLGIGFLFLAIYRRYISRPSRLDNRPDDLLSLAFLLLILCTGLFLESLRLSIIGKDIQAWAPLGNIIASLIDGTGLSPSTKGFLAMLTFRIHFFLVLGFIASIPYSKLFHMVSSPLNMIFRSFEPKGTLSHMDLEDEDAESFGVAKIEEFTWKQLMDLDACTRCGRCQDHCPAFLTEKPLSPKNLILDLKNHLHERGPQVLKAKAQKTNLDEVPIIISNVIEEDVLWACTTCRNCMEHCPVYVEHVDKIIDMRRYQVLMESKFPEELMEAFRGLEKNSNPWGLGYETRADWVEELDVPVMSEMSGEDVDYLFFVGCIRSYDDRNKKVAMALVRILNHLGTKFSILGMEEGCCGDPARRVGNEYLYQILAQTNIEILKRYKVKKILTTCPHCFNTLKNEYPQLGFEAEVIHHAEFLQGQIQAGRLKLEKALAKRLTYHDPCYLGRYSDIYDPPRRVLEAIPSLDIREMKRSRRKSQCCGAGGGWMWMDEKIGKRINIHRLEDALATDPEWIATACPFCVTMFDDAIKSKDMENRLKIWDIAELVDLSM
ncbi:MAG: heterodisulfide reductase-related iron-sulfur binding cluster [Candidatus Aminicenantes bacterium]|nr:heterodisulfide reductase-related iron-sulfur binding cluster [Candidatus Aminicenantes bacterium]MDH5384241.1 heterodisulfide reductase-related iron-sulfur binding cluster [Candidatus Aminicenantes bacterium]